MLTLCGSLTLLLNRKWKYSKLLWTAFFNVLQNCITRMVGLSETTQQQHHYALKPIISNGLRGAIMAFVARGQAQRHYDCIEPSGERSSNCIVSEKHFTACQTIGLAYPCHYILVIQKLLEFYHVFRIVKYSLIVICGTFFWETDMFFSPSMLGQVWNNYTDYQFSLCPIAVS